MSALHTPGPWRAEFLPKTMTDPYASIWHGDCYATHVADVSWSERSLDEHNANALLIAAAPTGREAAETAYIAILQIPTTTWRIQNQRVYCVLRDYIALATGKSAQEVQESFEAKAAGAA